MKLKDLNIKQVPFKDYYNESTEKKQIYLHHTAGGPSGEQVFAIWDRSPVRVATCVAISSDGTIVQGYSSKKWAYHLGLTKEPFKANGVPYISLDRISIGIEICAWGYLTKSGNVYKTYTGAVVPAEEVCLLDKPYKGHKHWHAYTDAQIESTRKLLLYWGQEYGIDLTYRPEIWDVDKKALQGDPGVYTHNSVRKDKADVYPDPRLIDMLKSLTKES